eukprot:GEMP01005266.1.p1 GENE.GEMP01005266.1~~GEMP01005266.1.p1  ORF type:complete len:321 (+),score=43.76 GEMP01005266.1:1563-2525(+)
MDAGQASRWRRYCDCGNGYDHMNSVRCVHEPFTCRTVCEAVRCMYGFDTTCSACKQDGETCIVPGCLNEVYPTPGCGMLFGSCDAQRRCRAWPGEGNWSPSSARGSSDDYCRDFYTSCAEMIDWCHVQKFAAGCPRTCKTCNPNYSTPMLALQRESFDASITRTSPDFPEVTVFDDESLVPPSDGLRYSDFLNDAARNPFGFGIFNPVHNTIAGMHYILPTRPPVDPDWTHFVYPMSVDVGDAGAPQKLGSRGSDRWQNSIHSPAGIRPIVNGRSKRFRYDSKYKKDGRSLSDDVVESMKRQWFQGASPVMDEAQKEFFV